MIDLRRDEVLRAYRDHVSVGMAQLSRMMRATVETRSEGPYVWDEGGERYLDCGGYGVFTLGHCHPRVVEAVVEQVRTLPLSTRLLLNGALAEAADALVRVAPDGLDRVYFGVSGADVVEVALKLARLNGRRRVVAMENGYHGKSLGALSVTGRAVYREPFEPLLADIEFVPFGDADALVRALAHRPEACVLLEPVQAEAGVIVPPDGYLAEVERTCREHGAFLVVDEIQTGLGRLGAWWGVDREGVTPDVLLAGKALGGGVVPVGALLATEDAFDRLSRDPLLHNSTFSGSPIAMAAVRAAVEAIEQEAIVERAAELGTAISERVAGALRDTCPALVREVRGIGLLIGIEWTVDFLSLDFLLEMLDRQVVIAHSMNAPAVSRLTPPAVLTEADVDLIEEAVRAAGTAMAAR
jgi:putrescine aminotransferase